MSGVGRTASVASYFIGAIVQSNHYIIRRRNREIDLCHAIISSDGVLRVMHFEAPATECIFAIMCAYGSSGYFVILCNSARAPSLTDLVILS
jgi:hypothetical protein